MSLVSIASRKALRGLAPSAVRQGLAAASAGTVAPAWLDGRAQQQRSLSSLSGGAILTEMAKDNPYKDVVRYEHKNRKWTLHHVDFYSEGLAIGLLENGLQPGDVVLSWLPSHFSESMVLQFACSKAGLVLYNLDPSLATKDPTAAKQALSSALTLTKANVLITQEAGDDVNYIRLVESVIPETRYFDFSVGMPFVTPRYPHLRLPIHTGFDQQDKWGMLLFKHMVVPSGNLDAYLPDGFAVDGSTPLLGELTLDASGIPTGVGPVKTNAQVQESGVWSTYSRILSREYHEVEGVGVIF